MIFKPEVGKAYLTRHRTLETIHGKVGHQFTEYSIGGRFYTQSGKVYTEDGKAVIPHGLSELFIIPNDESGYEKVRPKEFVKDKDYLLADLEDDFVLQVGKSYVNWMGFVVHIKEDIADIGSGPIFVDTDGNMYRANGTPVWAPQGENDSTSLYTIRLRAIRGPAVVLEVDEVTPPLDIQIETETEFVPMDHQMLVGGEPLKPGHTLHISEDGCMEQVPVKKIGYSETDTCWHLLVSNCDGIYSILKNLDAPTARQAYQKLLPQNYPKKYLTEPGVLTSWGHAGLGYRTGVRSVDILGPEDKELDPWRGVEPHYYWIYKNERYPISKERYEAGWAEPTPEEKAQMEARDYGHGEHLGQVQSHE